MYKVSRGKGYCILYRKKVQLIFMESIDRDIIRKMKLLLKLLLLTRLRLDQLSPHFPTFLLSTRAVDPVSC